jgi:glycosyltransferase involved in cell wall biosynthesis
MKNTPKVSVLTPLYNTDLKHLRECIESMLNQTFTDFEFLLLNDSPNNKELKKIVQSYKDPRIIYSENKTNLGISASRNKLLQMSRGEYLAIFDHDDISVPTRLEKEVGYLDEHPDIGVVSGNLEGFGDKTWKSDFPENNLDIKFALLDGCKVCHTASMIRKSVLTDNDIKWEAEFSPAEDYMLWIRLIGKTMFYNFKETLVYYRWFDKNTSILQKDKQRDRDALIKCIAYREYPYLIKNLPRKVWIKLFSILPIIKIKPRATKTTYRLFGIIPMISISKVMM